MGNVTGKEIRHVLEQDCNLSTREAQEVLWSVLAFLHETLAEGHRVTLGQVGTLEPYTAKSRKYLNPQTQETLTKPARCRVRFRMSRSLEDALS